MELVKIKELKEGQNRAISIMMVSITYCLGLFIPNISDAITLSGATVNPFIGFIFPILFYLKLDPKPLLSLEKQFAITIMIIIIVSSILGLFNYFTKEWNKKTF